MNDVTRLALLIIGGAFLLALALCVWLIGADRLFILALIFVCALGLAAILAASALPLRAWRKRDLTGEAHHYHDGTRTIEKVHTIDGRAVTSPEVKLLQLPAQPQGGAWPELLRAAYTAGALGSGQQPGATVVRGQDLAEYDLTGDGDGWAGDISG